MTTPRIVFCRLPPLVDGECDDVENLVMIDLLKPVNPVYTFLHELIHLRYPRYSETRVEKTTVKRWRRMSQKRRFELYKFLFNRRFINFDYNTYEERIPVLVQKKRTKPIPKKKRY